MCLCHRQIWEGACHPQLKRAPQEDSRVKVIRAKLNSGKAWWQVALFNASTRETEALTDLGEFKGSLVYIEFQDRLWKY